MRRPTVHLALALGAGLAALLAAAIAPGWVWLSRLAPDTYALILVGVEEPPAAHGASPSAGPPAGARGAPEFPEAGFLLSRTAMTADLRAMDPPLPDGVRVVVLGVTRPAGLADHAWGGFWKPAGWLRGWQGVFFGRSPPGTGGIEVLGLDRSGRVRLAVRGRRALLGPGGAWGLDGPLGTVRVWHLGLWPVAGLVTGAGPGPAPAAEAGGRGGP